MNLVMQRIKQGGYNCDPMDCTKSLADTIALIVSTEFNWGGRLTDYNDHLVIKTTVFGDVDTTTLSGTDEELDAIRNIYAIYRTSHTQGIVRHLLQQMGFVHNSDLIYNFDETCLVYKMWTEEDARSPDLLSLITTNVKEPPKPLTQKAIDEVIDVQKKLKLETGDGALAMLSKSLFS